MLYRWLSARRERLARIERDASDLQTFLGDHAYPEARTRAREARARQDWAGDRHWSRVAVRIADETDQSVGQGAANRYEAGPTSNPAP